MEKEKKKKKKGSYGKVLGTCVVGGCIIALLALFGDGLGLGLPFGGNGNGGGNGGQANGNGGYTNQETYDDPTYENGEGDPDDDILNGNGHDETPELVIRVVGNTIYHGDTEVEMNDLVGLLERYNRPGATWELHDEQAIMETFEIVEMLMRENMINYTVR